MSGHELQVLIEPAAQEGFNSFWREMSLSHPCNT